MFEYKKTMEELMQKEVDEGQAKGASALVFHKGKEIFFHSYGYADAEKKTSMKRDTIIRLFSMSKPITAVATMLLVERGKIDLRDPISWYLPEFAGQKVWTDGGVLVPVERENTIWDMLNMTSGITYPDMGHEPGRQMDKLFRELISRRENGERVDTREYLRRIAEVPLCFQPGARWMYGLSADVLGGVIEVVSGMSYGEFLKKEIFDPLEMKDTGFYVPSDKRERFAQIYEWKDEENCLVPFEKSHLGEYYGEDVAFESGGAGMVSTLDDYSHFALMMVQKGKYGDKRILGRKTVEFMTRNQLNEEQMKDLTWDSIRGYGYGCLMRMLIDPKNACTNASLGEFGWDGWTGNYVTMDCSEDLVFLYFIQRCGAGMTPMVRKLRSVTYGSLE